MSTLSDLRQAVAAMPPGTTISLPVEWLKDALEEMARSDGQAERLLTLEEVGDVVGRAVSTVRSWCNSGAIKGAFRLNGRDWRIPERALREYLKIQAVADEELSPKAGVGPVDLGAWRRDRPS